MTKVVHLARPRAGTHTARPRAGTHTARIVQTFVRPVPTPSNSPCDPVARQATIENALSMALYFIRQPGNTAANLWAATARANRALTLLKQASQGGATVGHKRGHFQHD